MIDLRDAFHGRSGYTLSLTNTADPNKHQYFAKYDWPRVLNPKITWPLEQHIEAVRWEEEVSESQILKHLWDDPDAYCAIIIETIQGEGGDNHFRTEFFKKLRRFATNMTSCSSSTRSSAAWGSPARCGPSSITGSPPT